MTYSLSISLNTHATLIIIIDRATHGGKTDANAHPHTDAKNRVAVIHNGTINNSYDLKKELQAQGVKFVSETDTEVIAQLIGIYLDKGFDTKDAVMHALGRSVPTIKCTSCMIFLIHYKYVYSSTLLDEYEWMRP
jgi:glucosamine--fructose-6-phosphate aminotransferase (isomerizing)